MLSRLLFAIFVLSQKIRLLWIIGAILHQYLLTKCFYYPHNKHGVDNFNVHSNLQFLREIPCDISWLSMPAFVRVIHLIEKIG